MREDTSIRTIYNNSSYIKKEHDPPGTLPSKVNILPSKGKKQTKTRRLANLSRPENIRRN